MQKTTENGKHWLGFRVGLGHRAGPPQTMGRHKLRALVGEGVEGFWGC